MIHPMADRVHVNIPVRMLLKTHLDRFLAHRLNPEIGFDADSLDTLPYQAMEAVGRRLLDEGISITLHAPFMDISPGSPDRKIRDVARLRLGQVVRLLPLFRPATVVCHTGYDHRRYWYIRELWLQNSLAVWEEFAGEITSHGARMMLENVYEESPHDLLPLLAYLRPLGVGFCLDSGHHAVFSNTPLADWVASIGPYIGQLHLHDNHGERDEHLALGQGSIDFRNLLTLVRKASPRQPVITLEPHREEDLLPSLRYLEGLWPW